MKRLATLLAIAAITAAAGVSAYAQGRVVVNNNPSNQRIYLPGGSQGSATLAADTFNTTIYYVANTGPAPTTPSGLAGLDDLLAGKGLYASGATAFKTGTGATAGVILPKVSGQATATLDIEGAAWIQVRAWSSTFATFEDALAQGNASTFVGVSSPVSVPLATGGNPNPNLRTYLTGGFQVVPVPEPSTIALGLIGLAGMFIIRRRK